LNIAASSTNNRYRARAAYLPSSIPLIALESRSSRQALVHHAHELAAVIGDAGMKLVRHGGGGNEIAPPELDRVNTDHTGGAIQQLLDKIARLRSSGAAIRLQRRRVGEHRTSDGVYGGNIVDAGRQLQRE
jgi:hypothetical protein